MQEVWVHSTLSYNLPLTILLGLVLLYWVLCLVGLFGMDSLDNVFDGDPHGGHHHGDDTSWIHSDGIAQAMLRFLNAADVPLIVVLSFLSLFLWTGAMLLNYFFNPMQSDTRATLLFLPDLFAALILTRVATLPLAAFLRKMNAHSIARIDLTGRVGIVRTGEITESFGQVELDGEGSYLVNAKLATGQAPLSRGARVLVVEQADEKGLYTVRAV